MLNHLGSSGVSSAVSPQACSEQQSLPELPALQSACLPSAPQHRAASGPSSASLNTQGLSRETPALAQHSLCRDPSLVL